MPPDREIRRSPVIHLTGGAKRFEIVCPLVVVPGLRWRGHSQCQLRLLRNEDLRMRTIRAAVLTVRTSIDYSRIIKTAVITANLVAGATAVLLAGLVAVAIGLD
jgi:hypothetical protein